MIEHKHLILKGTMRKPVKTKEVNTWLIKLVELLDMKLIKTFPHNPAVAHYKGENPGVTACALITTSHIVLHTWDETLDFQLDVYSCKEYSPKEVEKHCKKIGLLIDDKRFFDRKYNIVDDE